MTKHDLKFLSSAIVLLFFALSSYAQSPSDLPNIVIIYADDMGYGDVGCYGAKDIKTPYIDQIAQNGIRFTEFYSVSPVCSPSRYGLMTGRYPARDGIHGVFFPESWTGMDTAEVTMANMLKEVGYATGVVGKWVDNLCHNKAATGL
ncbi:MAG: sulfatase-like hydrolase/transferase, partial [Bacteroidota bacterium]